MKRIILFLIMFIYLAPVFAQAAGLDDTLGRLPVQTGGRVKPFQSFAKDSVLLITGKSSWNKQSATILIWRWLADPQVWAAKPLIPVSGAELREQFSQDLVGNRIAPNLVLNNMNFLKRVSALQQKEEKEKHLKPNEKKEVELYSRARLFDEIANGRIPGIVPHPEDPSMAWLPLEALYRPEGAEILANEFEADLIKNAQTTVSYLLSRIKDGDLAMADTSAGEFTSSLNELIASRDIVLDQTKINLELAYLKLRPFQLALVFYVLSLFLGIAAKKKGKVVNLSLALFFAGFLVHTLGFAMRIFIAGRPPVTNMYESIIWVSWGSVLFSVIFWSIYRSPVLPRISSTVAILGILVAESFPTLLDPSISPLVPVLRSNYWLTIHVLTITLGYGAFALNWGASHALTCALAFRAKKELTESLTEYVYRSLQVGVILLSCGTILGGVWASYSWGRFWGWDPKETWALIAILAYLAVLHSRTAGWLDTFGVGFWSALCFLTVLMAWYGVNFVLGVGLHSYGFGGGGLNYVLAFVVTDLFFLLFLAKKFKIHKS